MTGASGSLRILVTGFGAFPGVRDNPTAALVSALAKQRPRLGRLGIGLELAILPVVYAEIAPRLEVLTKTWHPDAILHFGLAARRKRISIETRAVNRLSLLGYDASGATSRRHQILPGSPQFLRSTFPAREIGTALGRTGLASRLSSNAGKYICNETLYLSLARSSARQIGFIHVPRLAGRGRRRTGAAVRRGPALDDLVRGTITTILVMARKSRTSGFPHRVIDPAGLVAASLDQGP
jgi:pyroglutamyl-peptidase